MHYGSASDAASAQKKRETEFPQSPFVRCQSAYLAAVVTGEVVPTWLTALTLCAFLAACFLATVFLAAGSALIVVAGAAAGAVVAGVWAKDTAATLESNTEAIRVLMFNMIGTHS
jgi:hypothetical protein